VGGAAGFKVQVWLPLLLIEMKMCCGRSCECLLKWGAMSLVACALFVGGVRFWLSEKHYVFSAEELSSITTKALEKNKGGESAFDTRRDLISCFLRF
jgi:hypothetical protein